MKKYENGFIEKLVKDGEYILEKESFKFRKAKILEKDFILKSKYKDLVGKTFDILYSYDYDELICIKYNDEEIWIEDNEYEYVDSLPEYIKIKDGSNTIPIYEGMQWIGTLNNTKEYYGKPLLDYNYEDRYEIKNSCELKIEDVLEDSKNYEIATKEEYERLQFVLINFRKEQLKTKIEGLEEELQALNNLEE